MYYIKRKKKSPSQSPTPRKKSSPDYGKRLDKVFSVYIRIRDVMPNGYFKCISCGQIKPIADADCGHYFSRRHQSTRYSEDNCHAECSYCNRFDAEHLDGYRDNLIRKIGETRYLLLKEKHNQHKSWSDWELKEMIVYYREKAKKLMSEKGIKLNL